MFARILERKIYRWLEKHLKLQSYDGTGNPEEHVEHVDYQLDHCHTDEVVKCKVFALTLTRSTTTWYKSLMDKSIDL